MAEYLQPEKKQEIFAKYGKSNKDTGSPESQVALFSYRIAHLTEHVKKNKKDVVTRRVSCWTTSRESTSRDTGLSLRSWVSADKQKDRKNGGRELCKAHSLPFFSKKDHPDGPDGIHRRKTKQ